MQTLQPPLHCAPMAKIKCPSCAALLDGAAPACPQCKFTLRQLDTKFGTVPLHARHLTDRASALTLEELRALRELMRRFETVFPQFAFSIFVTELPPGSSIKEFTFWLANRAQFGAVESTGAENFDLLLVIEPKRQSAAFTVGYGLEKYLGEDDLRGVLAAAESALRENELERAIRTCIEETTRLMRDTCKMAERIDRDAGRARIGDW
jgi:uncharacterized membrane protein YgcG